MASKKGSKGKRAERVRKRPKQKAPQPKKPGEHLAGPGASGGDIRSGEKVEGSQPAQNNGRGKETVQPKSEAARKKETIVKNPPPVLLPIALYFVFLSLCYALGYFQLVRNTVLYPVFALGSFAIVGYVIVAMRADHLKSSLGMGLVGGWLVLVLVAMALPLGSAIFYATPVAEDTLTKINRTLRFDTAGHGTRFMALLNGHFTQLEQFRQDVERELAEVEEQREAESEQGEDSVAQESTEGTEEPDGVEDSETSESAEDADESEGQQEEEEVPARRQAYSLNGTYTLQLRDAQRQEIKEFEGRFTARGQKRRLTKKGRAFHEAHNTTAKHVFRAATAGEYELHLSFLHDELSRGIDVTVYPWSNIAVLNYIVALLAMAFGAFIDFLLKAKKTLGWFAFGAGFLAGFGNYYLAEATPTTPINIYIFDLMIGGIIGLVFAFVVLYLFERVVLPGIVRKYRIRL